MMDKDKAIRAAKLTAGGILEKNRAKTAVTRAGGQIAPSKYLPNVPRAVHADGGRENGEVVNLGKEKLVRSITKAVSDVKSGAHQERMDQRAYKLHESGHLPLPIGTKVTPPQGWDMPSQLQIHGYWQDILHPEQHGYKLKSESGDLYEVQHQMHSGQNPYVFGGGFKAYSGPVRNRAGYSDEAMAPRNPILPTRTPEQSDQLNKEYDQLFGTQPDITKAEGGRVTDTDEFRNWFGNSVTHTNGEPHVFYTGTSKDKDFTSHNVGRHGAWFVRDPEAASSYAEQNDSQGYKREGFKLTPTNTASRVIPAYVKAENPYTGELPEEYLRDNYKAAQSEWFDTLRAKGHDSWVPASQNGNLVVALKEPQQIKSIFNSGKFDPNQKHMNKAAGGRTGYGDGGMPQQNGEPNVGTEVAPNDIATRPQAGGLPIAGGVRGGSGVLQTQNEAPLEGLPTKVGIPFSGGSITAGPDPRIRQVARDYMAQAGLPYNPPTKYAKVDPKRAARIASSYEDMKDDHTDPLTKASYDAMIKETMAQYKAAKDAGFKAEFWHPDKQEDPYKASPRLATEDVRNNHHMWVYPTYAGYGSGDPISEDDAKKNPLLQLTGETWNGIPVTVNDVFRAVHDYYGHAKEGVGFRGDGEENAWRAHASMFSPLARMAMTSETRGQNSWLNYGPHGEKNRTARTEDTIFAPQKIGIMDHSAHHDGAEDFMNPDEIKEMAAIRKRYGRSTGGAVDAALSLTRRFTKNGIGATMTLKPRGK